MKALNPSSFGVRGVAGKKFVAKKPNRVSAKCAILATAFLGLFWGRFSVRGIQNTPQTSNMFLQVHVESFFLASESGFLRSESPKNLSGGWRAVAWVWRFVARCC
jgi:hypothetical protein